MNETGAAGLEDVTHWDTGQQLSLCQQQVRNCRDGLLIQTREGSLLHSRRRSELEEGAARVPGPGGTDGP